MVQRLTPKQWEFAVELGIMQGLERANALVSDVRDDASRLYMTKEIGIVLNTQRATVKAMGLAVAMELFDVDPDSV